MSRELFTSWADYQSAIDHLLAMATKRALPGALVIPAGFAAALLLPLWVGGVLILVPLVAIVVMALAD